MSIRHLSQAQILRIPVGSVTLQADLVVPMNARAVIVFAQSSGSSRHGHRHQFVARVLQQSDFATVLMDLLTAEEGHVDHQTRELRFNIELLSQRLIGTLDWIAAQAGLGRFPIACLGASTGASASLVAAAERPKLVKAVVSRGGRPDLAGDRLPLVKAPSLFIVGGYDEAVLVLNQQAIEKMKVPATLRIVPRATHQFEEPGALAQVAELATSWFDQYVTEVAV